MSLAPPDTQRQSDASAKTKLNISIIVPVLNEAALIGSFLRHLRQCAPSAEIIVVDGGSADATRKLAGDLCDQLIVTECGRAIQMNAGARVAHGDVFWFLHADAQVPWKSLTLIAQKLTDPAIAGGFFRIRLPRNHLVYRLTDGFAHYAGRAVRIRCADHGFFCRREAFETLEGFPEVPLMEDAEFFRAMHRCGRVCTIGDRLIVSPRRYEEIGRLRLTFFYGVIAVLYTLGVPLSFLSWVYNRSCCSIKQARAAGQQERQAGIK
jgi:rSAM/selenodomain-associated transferase 2